MRNRAFWFSLITLVLAGCDAGSRGNVSIALEAEDTITGGLTPGTDLENIVDGWTVNYEQFVVAIGHVHLAQGASGNEASSETVLVVDLTSLPATGLTLTSFEDIPTGTWDNVTFETPVATSSMMRDDSVSQADFDAMVAGGCTYLIAGTLSNPAGETCVPGEACMAATEIDFRLCIPAATDFGPCSTPDGLPGLVVNSGLTTSSSITLHGDHMWFNAFPAGDELIERRAQWMANCDTDHDGVVTEAELTGAAASAIFPSPTYSLAGAPFPVSTAWDFVRAQVKTQGHWNGEGACEVDGLGHAH